MLQLIPTTMRYLVFLFFACTLPLSAQQLAPWKLVWQEEFNGVALDTTTWNYELGDGCPNLCGWGNNERQVYTKTNHDIHDGMLHIIAKKEEDHYTSTRITTRDKYEFTYGKIEARAKVATGKGVWPALWLLGANITEVGWPLSGEIDMLEYVGKLPQSVFTTVHTNAAHGSEGPSKVTPFPTIEEGYHVFSTEWDAEMLRFYVDEELVFTYNPKVKNSDTWPFDKPFYLIVNMAIGGNLGGPEVDDTIFPQDFTVDYLRVYQR